MDHKTDSLLSEEGKLNRWIIRLVHSDVKWLGRPLVKWLRFKGRNHPVPMERTPDEKFATPTGPYFTIHTEQIGDLLLWVPRQINSVIIDDLTGRYGYSHLTVDTGEVDLPTGKPVMMEVTIGQTVKRKFQDEYDDRPHVRIPLSKTGVDTEAFVACVKSRLGEPYDNVEALTLGEIDDPAKQMCSSLASECLPDSVRRGFAVAQQAGQLHRNSVSVHSIPNASQTKIFISPNGFAEYYGAPKGEKLPFNGFVVEPHPVGNSTKPVRFRPDLTSYLVMTAVIVLTVGIWLRITKYGRRINE